MLDETTHLAVSQVVYLNVFFSISSLKKERSIYAKALEGNLKVLYEAKLIHTDSIDPYHLKEKDFNFSFNEVCQINRCLILDFLLFRANVSTQIERRAYKSMDAFVQLFCNAHPL